MAITRWQPLRDIDIWEPFREIESLQEQINRLFDRFVHVGGDGGLRSTSFQPFVEIEDTPEAFHLKVELPGLDVEDIDVQVSEDSVLISGDRQSETKTEEKGLIRSELRYGRFERVISLPSPVQYDQAQAEYINGILSLTLPKLAQEHRKAVKVNLGKNVDG